MKKYIYIFPKLGKANFCGSNHILIISISQASKYHVYHVSRRNACFFSSMHCSFLLNCQVLAVCLLQLFLNYFTLPTTRNFSFFSASMINLSASF